MDNDRITVEEFFEKYPLYKEVDLNKTSFIIAESIFCFQGIIDLYCPECKKYYPFKCGNETEKDEQFYLGRKNSLLSNFLEIHGDPDESETLPIYYEREAWIKMICSRKPEHIVSYILKIKDNKLFKIGQYPSLSDMSNINLNIYKKYIGKEKLEELKKSYTLHSHNVNIGAFLYLRRIYEYVIEDIHKGRITDSNWNEAEYQEAKRLDEKINLLKDFLPKFLVENKQIYGILSKGVHELTEDECFIYFPILSDSLIKILDEKLKLDEDLIKEKQLKADLELITKKIQGN